VPSHYSQHTNEKKKGATIKEKGKRVPFEPAAEGTTTDPITAQDEEGKDVLAESLLKSAHYV